MNNTGTLRDIVDVCRTISLQPSPVLPAVLPAVRESVGIEKTVAYRVDRRPEGDQLDFCYCEGAGPPKRVVGVLRDFFSTGPRRWGAYDPACPSPEERNRAVLVYEGRDRSVAYLDQPLLAATARPLGIVGYDQMRVLVCDGPSLLTWLGGFSPEPFEEQQRERLEMIALALQPRLVLERQLALDQLRAAAFEVMLEAIPGAAFVLDSLGHVVHANRGGLCLLRNDPGLAEELRQAVRAPTGRFAMNRIDSPGVALHHLAVDRGAQAGFEARLSRARARWNLSPRQTQVLALLARGQANKTIADSLGCAASTVEVHVTQLLERSGTESRAQLVAVFWSELDV